MEVHLNSLGVGQKIAVTTDLRPGTAPFEATVTRLVPCGFRREHMAVFFRTDAGASGSVILNGLGRERYEVLAIDPLTV